MPIRRAAFALPLLLLATACAGSGYRPVDGPLTPGQQLLDVPRFIAPSVTISIVGQTDPEGGRTETTRLADGIVRVVRFGRDFQASRSNIAASQNVPVLSDIARRNYPQLQGARLVDSRPIAHQSFHSTGSLLRFEPAPSSPYRSCSFARGLYGINVDGRFEGQVFNTVVELAICTTASDHPDFVVQMLREVRPLTSDERARFDAMPVAGTAAGRL